MKKNPAFEGVLFVLERQNYKKHPLAIKKMLKKYNL